MKVWVLVENQGAEVFGVFWSKEGALAYAKEQGWKPMWFFLTEHEVK